jgi:hypothetical protein
MIGLAASLCLFHPLLAKLVSSKPSSRGSHLYRLASYFIAKVVGWLLPTILEGEAIAAMCRGEWIPASS